MKHAVIVAHPDPASLNLAIAHAYATAVKARGGEVVVRDLYRLEFNPCLQAGEIPQLEGFQPLEDVKAERKLLADVKVITFVYPLWFNAPPAMLKGYIDRVFGMGFGYGPVLGGGNVGLLGGRRLLSVSTSGSPSEWLRKEGAMEALHNLFDAHFAAVCGLDALDRLHFGGVTQGMRPDAATGILEEVSNAVGRLFPKEDP